MLRLLLISTLFRGIVTAIVRLVLSIKSGDSSDHTYWAALTGLGELIDFATVIICACAPVFPRFYQFVCRGKGPELVAPVYSHSRESPSHPPSRVEVIDTLYGWDKTGQPGGANEGPYFQLEKTPASSTKEGSKTDESLPKQPCPLKSAVGSVFRSAKDHSAEAERKGSISDGVICKTVTIHRHSSEW